MSKNNSTDNKTSANKVSIEAQYIKDFSYENPNGAKSLGKILKHSPHIDLSIDTEIKSFTNQENSYEVCLNISAKAVINDDKEAIKDSKSEVMFIIDLQYAGIFTLSNFTEEEKSIALGIYAPSMLFPFAREIVANVTRNGGFQPLMISPINFAEIYKEKFLKDNDKTENNNFVQ